MNTNTRPTKLTIALAALAAIGTAGGVSDYGYNTWSNSNGDKDGDQDGAKAYGQVLPNYGNTKQYSNGGYGGNGQYNYVNTNVNGVNNYNSDVYSQAGHQQFIPIVNQPVAYQNNNGYSYQNFNPQYGQFGQPIQSGNFLYTNTAVSKDQSQIPLPNYNSVQVQGSHQDTDGNFNIFDPVIGGSTSTSNTNLVWPGVPADQNQRKRKNSNSNKGEGHGHENGQNGNGYDPNYILIDPRQGIPVPQLASTFPANDHESRVVSPQSNVIFQGFPTTNTLNNQQYIPLNGQKYPDGPVLGDESTYGTPYLHGPAQIPQPDPVPVPVTPAPQVYIAIPNPTYQPQSTHQDNDDRNGGHHDNYNQGHQGQYQQNQVWNGGYAVGYANGDSQGQVGPLYNAQTLTPAQYGVTQNLRTNGGCSKC